MFGGHPILTPDGREIRVPAFVFGKLRRLGVLEKDRETGLRQIRPFIHELMKYPTLVGRLRRVLGPALDGPALLHCRCKDCLGVLEELDTKTHGRQFASASAEGSP